VSQRVSIVRADQRDRVRSSVGWWSSWRESLLPAKSPATKPAFLNTIVFAPQRAVQQHAPTSQELQNTALQKAPVGLIVINNFKSISLTNDYAKQLLCDARDQQTTLKTVTDLDAYLSLVMTTAPLSSVLVPHGKRAFSVEAVNAAGRRFQVMVSNSRASDDASSWVSILTFCDISSVLERHLDCEENINFVSHDMRFMLNSILLQAEQLKDHLGTNVSPLSVNALTQISQRAKQSLTLAEAFLEWRLLSQQKSVSMYSLDFVEIVASACEDANIQSREARVRIEFDCETQILVKGNFSLLYRATVNVLMNAVRVSRAGARVRVTITVSDNRVSLWVHDRGPGFPADVLAEFGAVDIDMDPPKISSLSNGSRLMRGLGLQMTRKVAQLHGGSLRLSNVSSGGGAAVEIMLPTLRT
jgi:signal transduction histidine kinase